jgi:hypothetical protein
MANGDNKKSGNSDNSKGMEKKSGYKPINEGYRPTTSEHTSSPPKAPEGGSGKSD